MPYLFVLDPALVYEVSVNLLSLADVPGGKPEWSSAPITALLTLWDRQEFNAGRESIVRAVVKNLQLLDLHMQVCLRFLRLNVWLIRQMFSIYGDITVLMFVNCFTGISLQEASSDGQKS